MPESKPERYLREIKELLSELVEEQRRKKKMEKWKLAGRILQTLAPFLLTILIAWIFYLKTQGIITEFSDYLKNLTPNFENIKNFKL